jgi:hypothetical protein
VGPPDEGFWQKECRFAAVLEETQQGPIRFRAKDCLPFGTAWNTNANTARAFGRDLARALAKYLEK